MHAARRGPAPCVLILSGRRRLATDLLHRWVAVMVQIGMLLFGSVEGGVLLSVDFGCGHDAARGPKTHHVVLHAHIVRLLFAAMDLASDNCVAIMDHSLLRSIREGPFELWVLLAVRSELIYVEAAA